MLTARSHREEAVPPSGEESMNLVVNGPPPSASQQPISFIGWSLGLSIGLLFWILLFVWIF